VKYLKSTRIWLSVAALIAVNLTALAPHAFAGTLTKTTILEIGGSGYATPMIANTTQQVAVAFTPASNGATTAAINFNNFTGGSVNTTQTATSSGCATYFPGDTPATGTLAASGTGTTVTVTGLTGIASGTSYCLLLTSASAVTNPPTGGVYSALVTVGSDSQTAAFDVLSAGANTYTVSATVSPTFTMSLGSNTDALGTLSATALTTSNPGVTVTASTNGASGYELYAKDANAGLTSPSSGHTIASVSTGANHTMNGGAIGTEGYALGVSANNTPNYAYSAGTAGGGLSNSAWNQIATYSSAVSNQTQTLHELANVSNTTQPGNDYSDTITVIGTGEF
jgi:hypothetical protein